MVRSSIDEARNFLLSARKLAVVGVSRNPQDFSRFIFRELRERDLDVVPVNPALAEADGVRAFARVAELDPPPDAVLLMVPSAAAEESVLDCLRARVGKIWFHRGAGPGSASDAVLALCAANRVEVIQGLCPMMALPGASFPHRVHGLLRCVFSHSAPAHACVH
jgi:predicted CoA-binding protein